MTIFGYTLDLGHLLALLTVLWAWLRVYGADLVALVERLESGATNEAKEEAAVAFARRALPGVPAYLVRLLVRWACARRKNLARKAGVR